MVAVVMQRFHTLMSMPLTITTIRMVTTEVVTITRRLAWAGVTRVGKRTNEGNP